MTNKFVSVICCSFLLILFTPKTTSAQIEFNGSIDVGLRVGGENSSFVNNGIERNYRYLHFHIPQANLFLFAPINEHWFFEARLQTDIWGTGELKNPYFTLANITWSDDSRDYLIKAGRFVSPVGFYSDRSILLDRTFHDLPLSYSYFVNISDQRGFWPSAGIGGSYTSSDVGTTTIYFGGYATGVLFDWSMIENISRLQLGVTSAAPTSDDNYTNLANAAVIGRWTVNPDIKWQFGFTGSYGSFMQRSTVNQSFRPFNPLEKYRQTIIATDVKYALGFWEVIAEAVYSNWFVPIFSNGRFQTVGNTNNFVEENFSTLGTNLDIKFEPPALTGSYMAVRFDYLNFIESGEANNVTYTNGDWDKDVTRLTVALGYKLARNVEAKVSFSEQTPYDTSLYTFRTTISAFF